MLNFSFPSLSRRKLVLLGIISVLIFIIPVTVFLVQQQQEVRSRAQKATNLSLTPSATTVKVNDEVVFKLLVNPGSNQINFMNIVINFDSTKLAPGDTPFALDATVTGLGFQVLSGPEVQGDSLSMIISLEGANVTNSIKCADTEACVPIELGSLIFEALTPTDTAATKVTIDQALTSIKSIGDPAGENVLSSAGSATVEIVASDGTTPSPSPTTAPSLSITPTPTTAPSLSITPTPTTEADSNEDDSTTTDDTGAPVCSTLEAEGETSGEAPFDVTLTATGNDSDGTITKVTFNFGDGEIEDVTESGGLGSESVSAQIIHTYAEAGDYTAQATLTDDSEATSSTQACKLTINVSGEVASPTASPTPVPATGPSAGVIGAGLIGAFLVSLGAILFFIL